MVKYTRTNRIVLVSMRQIRIFAFYLLQFKKTGLTPELFLDELLVSQLNIEIVWHQNPF